MPYSIPGYTSIALSGASTIIPNLNPALLYDVILRNGTNGTDAIWTVQTSQNANGSSPDAGASDYRWAVRRLTSAGTDDNIFDDADARIVLADTSNLQLNTLFLRFNFDPGNGALDWRGGTVASTGLAKRVTGFGYVNKTNTQALVFNITAGTFTGTLLYKPIA